MSIEQNICDAVDIIVDRAISQASFDRTISAIVVECVDEIAGKYKVKYQDSLYYATSDNPSTVYNVNAEVYVLVPGNDFSKDKKILGTVKSLGANYINSVEGDEGYEYIGTNVVKKHEELSLCTYRPEVIELYNADTGINRVDIDKESIEEYLRQSTHLIAGAEFKTKINKENRNYGNYGIIFGLEFDDDATQQLILKEYIVDVDNMIGQPYNLSTFTRQVEEFEINGSNFKRLKYISIFSKDFPKTSETEPDDIFIRNIEINGALQLAQSALDSYYLALLTPQGTFFSSTVPKNSISLKAEIKIKGKVIDNSVHNTEFYWFVEHAGIDSKHTDFCKYGGQGWKCLNESVLVEGAVDEEGNKISDSRVEWIPAQETFTIKKEDCLAYQTKYKCVCLYNNELTIEKEIIIKNQDADFDIEIVSSNGTEFSYDVGVTSLECKIDNSGNLSYNYYWSKKNNVGTYEALEETTEENERYSQALNLKKAIEDGYKNESFFKTQLYGLSGYDLIEAYIQEKLGTGLMYDEVYNCVVSYLSDKSITRLEKGILHNLAVKTITNFTTYSCSVYRVTADSEKYIGNASITITNSFDKQKGYSLIIHNGTQVFKYNEAGLSPAHKSNENPMDLPTLSFTLFDENGKAIEEEVIRRSCKVRWIVPTKETMLQSNIQGGIDGDGYSIYDNTLIFDYDILPTYNVNRNNNNIDLEVTYKDKTVLARTNFTFIKEGQSGTNGTDYICKIVPNIKSGDIPPYYPMLTFGSNNAISMNYNIADGNRWGTDAAQYKNWFKVQLWNLSELVYEGISGDDTYSVKWSILKNNYGRNTNGTIIEEPSFIDVTEDGIFSSISYDETQHPANIIKVTVEYDEKQYVATLPLITCKIINSNNQLRLKDAAGFNSVMYTSDGTKPKFDATNPFELEFLLKENQWIDISTATTAKYKPTYKWTIKGQLYNRAKKAWVAETLLTRYTPSDSPINIQKYQPVSKYDGQCINAGLEVSAAIGNGSPLVRLHIPIHFLLNKYGLSALNDWDGNSIEINEDEGMILSPQVGAGKKNFDNTFTGVLMGTVDDPADTDGKHKTGLIGYASGQRSIFLDAETGKAEFGTSDKSRIVIDPSQNKAQIYSGNYSTSAKTGMTIDFSTPEIKFGSGKFEVSNEGHLTAKGGGTIAGWEIGDDKLYKNNVGIASANNDSYAFWAGASKGESAKFSVTHDGVIKATSGKVGGWTIDDKNIYTGNLTSSTTTAPASGAVRLSKSTYSAKIANSENSSWRFNIGSHFGVTQNGDLYCNAGSIGGFMISDNYLQSGNKKVGIGTTSNWAFWAGFDGKDAKFQVTQEGKMTAKDVNIKGTITGSTITGGTISGTKISGGTIKSSTFYVGDTQASWKSMDYIKSIGALTVNGSYKEGTLWIQVILNYTKASRTILGYGGASSSGSSSSGVTPINIGKDSGEVV